MVDTSKYEGSFKIVDTDGDGLIDAGELKAMMHMMGETAVTDDQAKAYVAKIDKDGDDRISLEEFATFLAD